MTSLSETSSLAGASGQSTGYTIGQSIRFNDDDSAYMSRTPSSGGNRKKFTFSTWFKLGNSGHVNGSDGLFSAVTDSNNFTNIWINNSSYSIDFIQYNGGTTYRINLPGLLRDPSAWYHLVAIYDSGNAVQTDRMRLYLNGVRQTTFYQNSFPALDTDSQVNHTSTLHNISRAINSGTYNTYYFDGYQTEIHLLDGYAYGPEYFGEFKEDVGIWIPKEYDGSYGTNGFKIDGRDSSDLGDDESGNGNDFTTSGLQANDQRADSPTNNHVTFNPVAPYIDGATMSFKNGNLDVTNTSSAWGSSQTTLGIPGSGKWTFAFKLTNSLGGTSYPMFGIIDSRNQTQTDGISLPYQSGTPANSMVFVNTYQNSTQAYFFKGGAGSESTIGSAFAHGGATNGEWQWFVNSDDEELTVYHNGTVRLDAYDISFLTFPVFIAATLYDYDDLRLLNLPGTEYTPSISGYKAINTTNIGS